MWRSVGVKSGRPLVKCGNLLHVLIQMLIKELSVRLNRDTGEGSR